MLFILFAYVWGHVMDRTVLGKRIKEARKEHGLTGERLAEMCNINATYLRQIEGGTKTPSLPMFVELCRRLEVSPEYLLIDSLDGSCTGSAGKIAELMKNATPGQAELISRMIESAMSVVDER